MTGKIEDNQARDLPFLPDLIIYLVSQENDSDFKRFPFRSDLVPGNHHCPCPHWDGTSKMPAHHFQCRSTPCFSIFLSFILPVSNSTTNFDAESGDRSCWWGSGVHAPSRVRVGRSAAVSLQSQGDASIYGEENKQPTANVMSVGGQHSVPNYTPRRRNQTFFFFPSDHALILFPHLG